MEQPRLWVDCMEDALRDCVGAAGGPKRVAHALWPTKKVADAARQLNHCLDPERPEKLALDEIEAIADMGRKAGCHTVMHYLAQRLGYADPKPVEPEDEKARLQREYVAAAKLIADLSRRIQNADHLMG